LRRKGTAGNINTNFAYSLLGYFCDQHWISLPWQDMCSLVLPIRKLRDSMNIEIS
jgi:hypothetical protein